MIIEAEAESAEQTEQSLEATKQRIERAAEAEYEARLEAADDAARGALLGGAFTIAGGAVSIGAGIAHARALEQATPAAKVATSPTASVLGPLGTSLFELAPVAQQRGGEIAAERNRARAERIGRSIEQASVEADQLSQQVRRHEQRAASAIEAARGFVETESARSNATLSRG
jgi:hypothetical protein